MNLKKGTLLFLLLTCLTYTNLAQTDYELQGSDVTIDENGIITGCTCTFGKTSIIIPVQIGEKTIMGVGNNAFRGQDLVAVAFADESKVTSIGESAFQDTNITALSLPPSLVTIGDAAFRHNSLTELIFPGDAQLETIGEHAFQNNKITELTLPTTLTIIGENAFGNSKITTLIFPDNSQLTTIGNGVFENNNITELTLPTTLTSIGANSFKNNQITTLTFPDDSQLTTIENEAFQGNENEDTGGNKIKTLALPASLTTIGDGAFRDNAITELTFPDNSQLASIGASAFRDNKITELSLPTILTTIGNNAFQNNKLTEVTFNVVDQKKSHIKIIGSNAFSENGELTEIILPEHVRGYNFIYKDSNNQEYSPGETFTNFEYPIEVIPHYTLTAGDVTVSGGFIIACQCTFENKRIIIPVQIGTETITGIGARNPGVFAEKNLASLTFADGSKVTTIGRRAFYDNDIVTLSLPASLKTIGSQAFSNNQMMTELTFPNNAQLTTIGDYAFESNQITTLSLPPSLDSIGFKAFIDNNIKEFTFPDDSKLKTIEGYAFQSNQITKLSLPTALTTIGEWVFHNNQITELTIPNDSQLKTIGDNAFQGNDGEDAGGNKITTLTLPPSLTVIGDSAFYNNSLTTVTFNDDPNKSQIQRIGSNAFSGNTDELNDKGITLPNHVEVADVIYKDSKGNEYNQENAFTYFDRSLVILYILTADDVTVDNQGIITGCTCSNKRILIPEKIGDITITGIGDEAFKEKSLIAVAFETESQVVSIGNSAFGDNLITTLLLPTTLTSIGKNAFSGNTYPGLTGITLPEHAEGADVTYKDSNDQVYKPGDTFTNFERSLDIVIPPFYTLTADDVTVVDGIITACTCTFDSKRITIPVQIGTETITGIGSSVFQDKNLVSLKFADGSEVTTIGSKAFYTNSIQKLTLPASLRKIELEAFYNNDITELTIPNNTQLETIGSYAFWDSQIGTLTLPTTLTTIGNYAFQKNQLTSVTFAGDQNNKSMIRSIGIGAFEDNSTLTTITLPFNGNNNFDGYKDSNRRKYSEGGAITDFTLGYNAFIPYTLTAEDIDVDSDGIITKCHWDKFISRDISIPASITKDGNVVNIFGIGDFVFFIRQLTSVVLPEGLISIGVSAFYNNSLATLTLPSSVKYIGSKAFSSSNLTAVTFDGDDTNRANIISIGHEAFGKNTDLTSINLPSHALRNDDDFRYKDGDGIEYEEGAEFKDFDRSLYVDIPYTLTVDDIVVDANGMITECNCNNFDSRTITIPNASRQITIKGIGNEVFANKYLATLSFSDNSEITSIGNSAFQYNSITALSLPPNLMTIGGSAFTDNPLPSFILPSVTIEGYRTYWQDNNLADLGISPTINQADFGNSFELASIKQITLTLIIHGVGLVEGLKAGDNPVDKGQPLTLTAKPNDGNKFVKWVFEGSDISTPTYTIPNNKTQDNLSIEVHFEKNSFEDPVKLTIDFTGQGTVTPNIGINTYESGSTVDLTATPADGWRFDKWEISDEEDKKDKTTTVTVDANKTATAHFVELVTLTIVVKEGQGTTATSPVAMALNQYYKGASIILSATPDDGWKVDRWVNIATQETSFNEQQITRILNEDTEMWVYFVEAITLTVAVNNEEGGTVTPNNPSFSFNKGESSTQELTAEPNSGWRFDKWVITGGEDNNDNPITVTVVDVDVTVDADKTATAYFVQLVTLTTAVAEQQGGTIAPLIDPNGKVYDINTVVELTATPVEGWRFDKWEISDEENKTDKTTTITLDKNKSVTAHFVEGEEAITSILTEVVSATPYPNPVTSQITLKAKDGDLIQLFSQKGGQQYSTQHRGNEVHTIDVSALPVGVYLVRITDAEGNTTTKRIVKK